MDFTQFTNVLNELIVWKNNVIANSKKIFELDLAQAGVKWVAVWNESTLLTEKFNISDALNALYTLTNKILQLGAITRVGDTFTFSVGYQWRINSIIYSNASTDLTINPAADGNHRIDIAVLGTNNNIFIVQGVEVLIANPAQQPPTPIDTLLLCSFNVEEDTINDPNLSQTVLFLQKVRIRKGFNNFDELVNQKGDIFQFGMVFEDKPVFVDFAVFTGGDINDNNNYTGMSWKEYDLPTTEEFGPDFGPDLG